MAADSVERNLLRPEARGGLTILGRDELQIARQGAQVIAWHPPGAKPVLFLSPRATFQPGRAIRGGVPICFPWFGPHDTKGNAPQHGFARTREWKLESSIRNADKTIEVRMTLSDDEDSRALWPHAFSAAQVVRSGSQLTLALEVRNTGDESFTFGAALHSYFSVSDVRQVAIKGLEDTAYLDRVDGGRKQRGGAGPLRLTGPIDRTYLDTTAACTIEDPGWSRRIVINKLGSRTTVVWNPWIDQARAMTDLGDDDWARFVCVETCNAATDVVTLQPGAAHRLVAEISVEG